MSSNTLLRNAQLAMLDIAKEIKRVCDEYDIRYFMDSGTLLGAVRHKGFIPWDDDMDIGMLRKDYERFIKIAPNKLKDGYFLQTWNSDPGYPYAFAKVRKLGTIFIEASSQFSDQKHREIWVDIFPYDVLPDDVSLQKRNKYKLKILEYSLWMKCGLRPWMNHNAKWEILAVKCKYIPYILYGYFHDNEWLKKEYEYYLTRFNNTSSKKYVSATSGGEYGRWSVPRGCLDNLKELNFEDTSFLAPADFDTYLTIFYGEYMKLPPAEKRENRHHIVKVKI